MAWVVGVPRVATSMAGMMGLRTGLLGRSQRPVKRLLLAPPPHASIFFSSSSSSSSSASSSTSISSTPATAGRRKLVLYSKPGCCLCDGLKEKLLAAFSLTAVPDLHDVHLEIRDITTNPEWEKAYQYEIPVLATALPDGSEEPLPRISPRLGVELLHTKIAAALGH